MTSVGDPEAEPAPSAQWDLTIAQARAHRGKGQRGGAFLVDRETILAVADRLEAGVELARLVLGMARQREEMLESLRRTAQATRALLEKYARLTSGDEAYAPLLQHLEETIVGLEAILAEDHSEAIDGTDRS